MSNINAEIENRERCAAIASVESSIFAAQNKAEILRFQGRIAEAEYALKEVSYHRQSVHRHRE